MPLMEINNLSIMLGTKTLCNNLSFEINSGETLGILGQNGVGKTILLHTLAGLRKPTNGEIILAGNPILQYSQKAIAKQLAILFQHYEDTFPSTVIETVLIGRHPHLKYWDWETKDDLTIAKKALKVMSLDNMEERQIDTLSGGERRRLAIATVLTQTPDLYLLDEPTNHLDIKYQQKILTHFQSLTNKNKNTVIMTLHDVNQAARFCDNILMLFDDGSYENGPTDELLCKHLLERLYQHPLKLITSSEGNFWMAE